MIAASSPGEARTVKRGFLALHHREERAGEAEVDPEDEVVGAREEKDAEREAGEQTDDRERRRDLEEGNRSKRAGPLLRRREPATFARAAVDSSERLLHTYERPREDDRRWISTRP